MLGNFTYCNPTKLYFGKGAIKYPNDELPKYGKKVVLIYGGGSIKKNGIYDEVIDILKSNGKDVAEISGVMPNPTVVKLYEGMDIARRHGADLLLAVGGGSVCDYAKALAVSVHCEGDPWEKYYIRFEEPVCPVVPVGCVLTMVGTGSEMNAGSVITNHAQKLKIGHVFADESIMPRFSVLAPSIRSRCRTIRWWRAYTIFSATSANSIFRARTTTPAIISAKVCSGRCSHRRVLQIPTCKITRRVPT